MKMMALRLVRLVIGGLALPGLLGASVLETKSLTRDREAVVVAGSSMNGFYGLTVNSSDATQSPNQLFVWAFDAATGWRQVVFQIDEVNNTYPTRPGPDYYDCDTSVWTSRGGVGVNYYEPDDGLWDSTDELVFMTFDLGDRVSLDEWAPGASTGHVRYEIAVTDPLNPTQKGWAYVYVHTTLPTWTTTSYVTWNEGSNVLTARDYILTYPTNDGFAMHILNLSVTPAGGGTDADLLEQQRWRGNFYFTWLATSVARSETQMQTQFALGCYSNNTMGTSPWLYKTGRVRISRYYWTCPTNAGGYTGDTTWKPMHNNQYFATFFHEDQYMNHSCPTCDAEANWVRDYLDHTNAMVFDFYTSAGDAVVINGSTETLATTPTWTWSQSSSVAGGFVKLYPLAYMALDSPNVPQNYYLDDASTNAEAGYYLNEPAKTSSTHHDFYYFMLPANATNVGQQYRNYVNTPLIRTFASQAFVVPPQNFDGILTATDVNGACVDQGVEVAWDNVLDWNDGCTVSCTNRRFVIYRSAVKVRDEYNLTLSAWTDTTGANRTIYNYGVEACNHSNICTALGNTLPGVDYVSTAPTLASTATMATDHDACTGDGIDITWTAPSDWMDNGEGSRQFDLYWEVDTYAAPIQTNVSSPMVYDAVDGESHQYRIRAVNGCTLFTNYTASAGTTDQVGADPTLPSNPMVVVTDLDSCSFTGVQVAWNPVGVWGDNGAGTQRYDLYWSRDGFAAPIVANAASPVIYPPPDSNPTTYRIIATNGCSRTAAYTDGIGADGQTAPNFAGAMSVTDGNACAVSTVTIAWVDVNGDGPEGWNDGGAGPFARVYRIFRDGAEITNSPVPDGASFTTDQPPAPNTAYSYVVQAVNLDGCYTAGGGAIPGTDNASVAPTAAPAQTLASDECDRTEAPAQGVQITWDAVTDWGDYGLNPASRRYYLYFSGNNYSSPIASALDGTTILAFNPPDNVPYVYRITARNGCSLSKTYTASNPIFDKTSCAPSCTVLINDNMNVGTDFSQTCFSRSMWAQTAGIGNGGTQGWRATTDNRTNRYAALRLTTPVNLLWTADVKLRFWSSVALASDDAGIVEIWTDNSGLWRKVDLLPYPNQTAAVPNSIALGNGDCATTATGGTQPAFQGAYAGFFYEVRLDSYLIPGATTQINIGFRVATGGTTGASTWDIDDVMIGFGIADGVWWWSLNGDLSPGVVKSGTEEAVFSWEDGGIYQTDEFRIYRSDNPADIRNDASSSLIHSEADTDAASYSWTTAEGSPAAGTCWFYKIYGFKDPCGESNQGEN